MLIVGEVYEATFPRMKVHMLLQQWPAWQLLAARRELVLISEPITACEFYPSTSEGLFFLREKHKDKKEFKGFGVYV